MNKSLKSFIIRTAMIATLSAAAVSHASAGVVFFRPAVVVAPMVVAPVVVVAPIYVPVCRFVAVPFVNAYTGVTYLATRRVCN